MTFVTALSLWPLLYAKSSLLVDTLLLPSPSHGSITSVFVWILVAMFLAVVASAQTDGGNYTRPILAEGKDTYKTTSTVNMTSGIAVKVCHSMHVLQIFGRRVIIIGTLVQHSGRNQQRTTLCLMEYMLEVLSSPPQLRPILHIMWSTLHTPVPPLVAYTWILDPINTWCRLSQNLQI